MPPLVLASTSRYRRELLERMRVPFRVLSAEVDESPRPGETTTALAGRLAEAKARAVAERCPGMLVLGSDQVADLDGRALGKPGSIEAACRQLAECSGRTVRFHTAACLVDNRASPPSAMLETDTTCVIFRSIDADAIARYVDAERPLDCAGSFKMEGLGISLFERIESNDPTALIGLPLIAVARLLRAAGCALP